MFERKLLALEFHSPHSFDHQDEKQFRNLISWLENQKIRLYKVEERVALDQVDDPNWPMAFESYLNELQLDNLTINTDRQTQVEKILAHAVRLEYSDNVDKYNTLNTQVFSRQDSNQPSNPLESLDFNSEDFKQGMYKLQRLLNIPSKENDSSTVLQAISKLIHDKLRPEVIQAAVTNNQANGSSSNQANNSSAVQISLDSVNLGFDTNDKVLNDAAKILRLLHIQDLRDLQTKINETIVNLQTITANPKTDASLGKVGS